MSNSEIVNEIATDASYREIVDKITRGHELKKDLFQEVIIVLLEYDSAKLLSIYNSGGLKFFFIAVVKNNFNSSTSRFYKKYRKECEEKIKYIPDYNGIEARIEDNEENKYQKIIENLKGKSDFQNSQEWYKHTLFIEYLKQGSMRKLEKKTGISLNAIAASIREYRDYINTLAR